MADTATPPRTPSRHEPDVVREEPGPAAACPARALALCVGALCLVAASEVANKAPDGDPGRVVEPSPPAASVSRGAMAIQRGERLDLNVATVSDLELLPRIGPALAERIVAFRSERGRLDQVEDLLQVRGIGVRTLDRLRPLVRVDTKARPVP